MGSFVDYRCRGCGFSVSLGGPIEFTLGADGHRRAYGHPVALDEEARARGVDGFWMTLWCPPCRTVRQVITVEFTAPQTPLDAWAGRGTPRPGYPADMELCPECAAELEVELDACPLCREGPLDASRAQT